MKPLEHHDDLPAMCGTLALIACVEPLAEGLIAYVRFMGRVLALIVGWFA
jgi:hypothetical protein